MAIFILSSTATALADTVSWGVYELKKVSAKASSTLIEKGRPASFYAAHKAADNNHNTVWCEGKKGDGHGETLEVNFQPTLAYNLRIQHGVTKDKTLYNENNRIKDYELLLYTSTGKKIKKSGRFMDTACNKTDVEIATDCSLKRKQKLKYINDSVSNRQNNLVNTIENKVRKEIAEEDYIACMAKRQDTCLTWQDNNAGENIKLDTATCLTGVKLTIKSVYPGNKYNDTCVTEIGVYQTNKHARGVCK